MKLLLTKRMLVSQSRIIISSKTAKAPFPTDLADAAKDLVKNCSRFIKNMKSMGN